MTLSMRRWSRSGKSGSARTAERFSERKPRGAKFLCSSLFFLRVRLGVKLESFSCPSGTDSCGADRPGVETPGYGRESQRDSRSIVPLVPALEAIASLAFYGDGFGDLEEGSGGVRQVCVFAIDEAQLAFQLQFAHRDADQFTAR